MRIFLIGSYWRGSREESYRKAFECLGCEVIPFDTNNFFPNMSGKSGNFYLKIKNRILWHIRARRFNKELVKRAVELNPELVFVIKGKEVNPNSLKEIKRWNTSLVINFNTDDFFAPRYTSNTSRWLKKSIPLYHALFYYKPYALKQELVDHGAKRVEELGMSYDPEIHRRVELTEEEKKTYSSDVVFVGNPETERIGTMEAIAKAGVNLKVYGPGWNNISVSNELKKCIVGKGVYADEMAKVYSGAKIVLTFIRRGDRDLTNSRLFEVPATGSFMLVERNDDVLRFFKEGEEIECFGTDEELVSKIKIYINDSLKRDQIRQAGYKRCVDSGYNFEGRAKHILKVYRELWTKQTLIP